MNAVVHDRFIESGDYRAVVDGTYPLEDVIEATRYVETGQKTGNVVLRAEEMELGGLEPPTSWVRSRRSPN
jgi:Zinc-binding dehydrogenase